MTDELAAPTAPTPAPAAADAPALSGRAAFSAVSNAIRADATAPAPEPVAAPEPAPDLSADATAALSDEGRAAIEATGATFDEAVGRYRNADGTFATVPAEGVVAEAAPADPAAEPEPAAPPAVRVLLPGLAERGETDEEIEVSDPKIAERLQRLANDGLRRKAFNEMTAAVESDRAAIREFQAVMRETPEVVVAEMPRAQQITIARQLLVEHLPDLVDDIAAIIQDPTALRQRQLDVREALATASGTAQRASAAERQAVAIERSVRALIPETVDAQTADDFMRYALVSLQDAARTTAIGPEQVPLILARELARFNFAPAPRDTTAAAPAPTPWLARPTAPPPPAPTPAVAVARPVSANAAAIADRARSEAARLQAVQRTRATAAAIPPAGRGAASVSVPPPVDATKSIAAMGNFIRQQAATPR